MFMIVSPQRASLNDTPRKKSFTTVGSSRPLDVQNRAHAVSRGISLRLLDFSVG
jgi:hypothetical protein